MAPFVDVQQLSVHFRVGRHQALQAVRSVDLAIQRGETVGLVGESGSGKSTLARTIVRAERPAAGSILFDGQDLAPLSDRQLRPYRSRMQMIFQDPFGSLDPRMRVGDVIGEPLRVHRRGNRNWIRGRVAELLEVVGLDASAAERSPAQFSGGQRQRISVARALALEPQLLVADEPVSALDVSIQAQIISLLNRVQDDLGLTTLVIAHDLALVHQISDRIAVMYLGEIVEEGTADEVVFAPQHPYTASLLSATPVADPDAEAGRERIVLSGEQPSPLQPPTGCSFHTRCPIARPHCATDAPPLVEVGGRRVACHYAGEIAPVIVA
ncbi:ABC transporter ATP-binding protein [Egicoccus sp. AB-alg2]|uniref:ABC transporter ATP-binding protein n=1 Tax=Egicoccus sp. AB-alg2 TaxID=3242693 RepID=UPI00359DA319